MKRIISYVLILSIIVSIVPVMASTDEVVVNEGITVCGTEASAGDRLYYIEDGKLMCSVNNERPQVEAENATWVISCDDGIYYSVPDGNNTYIRKAGGNKQDIKIFCPVDAFDIEGDFLYYSYNGELFKLNVTDNTEITLMADKNLKGFYMENGSVVYTDEKKQEEKAATADTFATQIPDFYHKYDGDARYLQDGICAMDASHTYFFEEDRGIDRCYAVYPYKDNIISPWQTEIDDYYYVATKDKKITIYDEPFIHDSHIVEKWSVTKGAEYKFYSELNVNYKKPVFAPLVGYLYTATVDQDWVMLNDGYGFITRSDFNKCFDKTQKSTSQTTSSEEGGVYTLKEGVSLSSVILKIFIDPFLSSSVFSFIKGAANWVKEKFAGLFSVNSSESVLVLGTVTNADGVWYLLGDNTYVLKKEFDKYFRKVPNSSYNGAISIIPTNYPRGSIKRGVFYLSGTISSSANISSVVGSVINVNTGEAEISKTVHPWTTTYSISGSALDNGMRFSTLKAGNTYYLTFTATDVMGNHKTWTSSNFTVYEGTVQMAPTPTVSVSSIEYGQRLTATCSDGNALIHIKSNSYEVTGYGSAYMDFTGEGTYGVSAWTTKSGYSSSSTVSNSVHVAKSPAPVINDAVYKENYALVTLSGQGNIYYTINGAAPTKGSTSYTEPIKITSDTTVKAISAKYGSVNSDVASKTHIIAPPEAPVIKLDCKDKIAQGKAAYISWKPAARAYSYTVYLIKDGEVVQQKTTKGTNASFVLDERSETENFTYSIKVVAENFKGKSPESNYVSVMAMHPVTVTFEDRITRTSELTEEKLNEIKSNVDAKYGEGAGAKLEGNVISVQRVDYDTKPSKPSTVSKEGFTFSGWSAGLYESALEDKTVYAEFDINTYKVIYYETVNNQRDAELSNRVYMYSEYATPPETYQAPDGYMFVGWCVDSNKSKGVDYTFVDGDIYLDAVYRWENEDLPVLVKISGIERNNKSYKVSLKIKTPAIDGVQGRIIAALYTADGRNVYTQVRDMDVSFFEKSHEWDQYDDIVLNYTSKVSTVAIYIVRVDNDKTGGAISPVEKSSNITYTGNTFWTEWSEWSTEEVSPDETTEVNVRYRYRDLEKNTSTKTDNLEGWGKAVDVVPHVGNWIDNGKNAVSAVNSKKLVRKVKTTNVPATYETQYRYGRYRNSNTSYWHFCKNIRTDCNILQHTAWSNVRRTPAYYDYHYCSGTNHGHQYPANRYNNVDYWNRYLIDGSAYYWEETRSVQTGGGYSTYKYQDTTFTYYFERWPEEWKISTKAVSASETRQVYKEYQFRTRTNTDTDIEEGTVYTKEINGNIDYTGTEYIPEENLSEKTYNVISGPYYKTDSGEYILVNESVKDVTKYRYGRFTNGVYSMPCKLCAQELYGGVWTEEYTEWITSAPDSVNENAYTCENSEHFPEQKFWNEYVVGDESYCFMEEKIVKEEVTYEDTTKYYYVNSTLEGKVGTVLVYKKTNTDPTQEQLEYVEQIEIGPNNSYSFVINSKEALDYFETGDFVISIAIEGSEKLVNLQVVEAPVPEHTVTFYLPDGTLYKEIVVKEGESLDVNEIGIPETEGYSFVKWDSSVVNIIEDKQVRAIMEKKLCTIAYVDYVNQKTELAEVYYGDPLAVPVVESVDGMVFEGWNIPGNADAVTQNMVVDAIWTPVNHKVIFRDFDGNIISEQFVAHGQAATPPSGVVKDGLLYTWDISNHEWWNVTYDMDIYPYDAREHKVEAPYINVSNSDIGGDFFAELMVNDDTTDVYYTVDCEITPDIVDLFITNAEEIETESGTTLVSMGLDSYTYDADVIEAVVSIEKYTDELYVFEGSVIYAFAIDNNGNISPISVFEYEYDRREDPGIIENEYEIYSESPQIILPSITVKPGETVEVPVSIKNNPGLDNLSLIFSYDAENLLLENAANGDVFKDSEFSSDLREDGSCKLSWYSSDVNTTDGILTTLSFTAGENGGKYKIGINIDEATADDEEKILGAKDSKVFNIGMDAFLGDVNNDGEADFTDAIHIIRYDVGMTDLSSGALKLADVNNDGEVDFADAIKILRYDAGLLKDLR